MDPTRKRADQPIDVSIIVVNWNSREFLRHCIASIHRHAGHLRYELIVVDSGSYDGCGEMLADSYPDVRFLQSADNVGFARANNLAARESVGRSLLFLNPDTELLNPAIDEMFRVLGSRPDVGLVGARLLNSDGSVQSSCVQAMPTVLNKVLDSDLLRSCCPEASLWGTAPLRRAGAGPEEVDAVSGACLMVDREVFTSVGGFSEEYFMYAEDIDLAYKVRRAGRRNHYAPGASVVHHGGSSTEHMTTTFQAVMMPEATWRFFRKTRGLVYAQTYRVAMMASAVVRLTVLLLIAPVAWARGRGSRWKAAGSKWCSVLNWTFNGRRLVSQYYKT
jgi:GT2 family glycosyltransferase